MALSKIRSAATQEPLEFPSPLAPATLAQLAARYGSPLVVIDCAEIRASYRRLAAALPRVDLYYALKPLPEPAVVETLRDLGAGFDLATGGEVELVRRAGVRPGRCVHTHPIKRDADIREALRFGVRVFVADNPDELGKFVRHRTRAEVLLRVATPCGDALVDLSRKFGCEPAAVPGLLDLARRLGVTVRGLSFHAGSQPRTPDAHVAAVTLAAELMAAGRRAGHAALDTLDIGGGFPVTYLEPMAPIEAFCAPIRAALEQLPPEVRLLAEPGRYLVAAAGSVVCTVIGRAERQGRTWYYLDDGLYGSFNGQLHDHVLYPLEVPKEAGEPRLSVLAGPTCDSIDVVREDVWLPSLESGDLVIGRMMGAYTCCSASDFNFVPRARIVAVNRRWEMPAPAAAS